MNEARQPYQVTVQTSGGVANQSSYQMPPQQAPIAITNNDNQNVHGPNDVAIINQITNPAPNAYNPNNTMISSATKFPGIEEVISRISPPTYNEAVNNDRINFDLYKRTPSTGPTS